MLTILAFEAQRLAWPPGREDWVAGREPSEVRTLSVMTCRTA